MKTIKLAFEDTVNAVKDMKLLGVAGLFSVLIFFGIAVTMFTMHLLFPHLWWMIVINYFMGAFFLLITVLAWRFVVGRELG